MANTVSNALCLNLLNHHDTPIPQMSKVRHREAKLPKGTQLVSGKVKIWPHSPNLKSLLLINHTPATDIV